MKILIVCAAGRLFGKESVTLSLMEGLRSRGNEVRCISSDWRDGRFERRLQELSIPYDLVPLGFISKTLSWPAFRMTVAQALRMPRLWTGYRKVVNSFQPDVVLHSTFHHVFLLWPLLGDQLNVFHVHDSFAPTTFYRTLFSVLSKRINLFIGVSDFVARTLVTLGLPGPKVCFVLNGIAANLNSSAVGRNGSNGEDHIVQKEGPIQVGIVGQIGEWKGHEDLIDALYILKKRQEPFVCRIFGSGSPEFAVKLKSKIEAYDLTDEVEWMGFVDDQELIYRGMDVCVVPSRIREGFGMVAAEAVMYGVPVIASRIGALPEVVPGDERGYLVDPRSPKQIAAKILEASALLGKRSGIRRIAHQKDRAALSAERMVDELESLFESLIATKPRVGKEIN